MIRVDPKNPRGLVWLASYPKSGNTWLRMYLYQLQRIFGGFPREADEINRLERSSTYEARLTALFQRYLGKPLVRATVFETMRVRPQVQAALANHHPAAALVKTHNLLGHIKGMPTIHMPESRGGIYIVRDPRDVAPSLAKHLGSTIDEAIVVMGTSAYATPNAKDGASEVWGSWSENVRSWTSDETPSLMVVRYEDMLAKPTETFTSIARHLRLEPTDAQIAEAIELSSFEKLKRQEEETGFAEKSDQADRFFVTGKAGGWREKLSPSQTHAIVSAHREQMERFGYR